MGGGFPNDKKTIKVSGDVEGLWWKELATTVNVGELNAIDKLYTEQPGKSGP